MAQALLPLKDLVGAKSRLSGILRPSERRALAQAMVEDVLTVLADHPLINRVTLVSDDPAAHMLAASYGADYLDERALDCSGLNPVIEYASAEMLRSDSQTVLVLHGDLPLLCAADVSAVLQLRERLGGLVIGTDLAGEGTNMLAFDVASRPLFQFGPNSCARHRMWAELAAVAVSVLQREGIACDVDEPQDLAYLLHSDRLDAQGKTVQLLNAGLRARVELALDSMSSQGMVAVKQMEDK